MARQKRFTFLCDEDERKKLTLLATRLNRTQSDAIRLLIREAVHQLEMPVYSEISSEETDSGNGQTN